MLCRKVEPMVRGLAKDYDGRVECRIENYAEGDSPALITEHGLDKHGMIVTDASGKLLWKESGHKQQRDKVAAALDKLLAAR